MALSRQIEEALRSEGKPAGRALVDDAVLSVPSGDPVAEAAERRKAMLVVTACAAARHGCELSSTRGVCLIREHLGDLLWAHEILQAAGLAPTPRNDSLYRHTLGICHRPEGRCPLCDRLAPVRLDGTLGSHRSRGRRCHGEGARPKADAEAAS